jgi:hypothetical protein
MGVVQDSEHHVLRILKNPIKSLRFIPRQWECEGADQHRAHSSGARIKPPTNKPQNLLIDPPVDGVNMMME